MENILFTVVAIILAIIILLSTFMYQEKFDPVYRTEKDSYVDNSFFAADSPEVLSHGTVQKYKTSKDRFTYELLYNLPEATAPFQTVDLNRSFNAPVPEEKYVVYMGDSDKKNMQSIGYLTRSSDGYHKLKFVSKEDYKTVCIVLGKSIVSCISI